MTNMRKTHPLFKIINHSFIHLPPPSNISSSSNFPSLLPLSLMLQIITPLFLPMHYTSHTMTPFSSLTHISPHLNYPSLIPYMHPNPPSMFFISLFLHLPPPLYYPSYTFMQTSNIPLLLLFPLMPTPFMPYLLPSPQMSFSPPTLITNLLSPIPYIPTTLLQSISPPFSLHKPTFTPFFPFHFILPFIIPPLPILHLLFLHQTPSNNPTPLNSHPHKIPFHPYYTIKHILPILIMFLILMTLLLFFPHMLPHPHNYMPPNPLNTPPHIKPQSYFLFPYPILPSIPNKLPPLLPLILSILILPLMPFLHTSNQPTLMFPPITQIFYSILLPNLLILTSIPPQPLQHPFIIIPQLPSISYFSIILILMPISPIIQHKMLKLYP